MAGLPEFGAASIGAVAALIVTDRLLRERPVGIPARLGLAAWATTLAAGVTIETALLAGHGELAWLGTGAAISGLARMAVSSSYKPPLTGG